jgi:hypothetical protein
VALFLHDGEQTGPGEVGGDAIGLLEHDAQPVQGVVDLDAVVHHVLVEPVGVDCVRQVHGGLFVPASHEYERVLDAQVRVVADAGDDEDVAGAVVGVEVRPVVEVAVRRPG